MGSEQSNDAYKRALREKHKLEEHLDNLQRKIAALEAEVAKTKKQIADLKINYN